MEERHYLRWIGRTQYPQIKDFWDEADKRGRVSLGLPSQGQAKGFSTIDTVCYLAHAGKDDFRECQECLMEIPCSECRTRRREMNRCTQTLRSPKAVARAIDALEQAAGECELCDGEMVYVGGSGGTVRHRNASGRVDSLITWRDRGYWMPLGGFATRSTPAGVRFYSQRDWKGSCKAPFVPDVLYDEERCEACHGLGRLPVLSVFGVLVPTGVEYIDFKSDWEKNRTMTHRLPTLPPGTPPRVFKRVLSLAVKHQVEGFKLCIRARVPITQLRDMRLATFKQQRTWLTTAYRLIGEGDAHNDRVTRVMHDMGMTGQVSGSVARFDKPLRICTPRFRYIRRWKPGQNELSFQE